MPDAVHIAMNDVPQRLADVPTDRQVMVICQSGGRSRAIMDFLKAQGVDAFNVTDGTQGWAARGWPLDR